MRNFLHYFMVLCELKSLRASAKWNTYTKWGRPDVM